MINTVLIGDCRDALRQLIQAGIKVQTCVTSPPYWGLRDYGTAKWEGFPRGTTQGTTLDWQPTCTCGIEKTVPCIVLDPFFGSGTTGEVCERLGRHWLGCELNPAYEPLWKKRTQQAWLGI